MAEQVNHEMILETVHKSGAEEWYCPTCGRRFLMEWSPAYKKVVLDSGDESAVHSGWVGRLNFHSSQTDTEADTSLSLEELEALQPWIEWMERVNFAALWDRTMED